MGKYRVCVYAICKNEEAFVEGWMKSMGEADDIVLLDTGSTDRTVELLQGLGAQVTVEKIAPWRFDVARNRSLDLVPRQADICVCTDLDEVFEPGWRERIERAWENGAERLSYRYTWSFDEDGREGVVFWADKIHANHRFHWVHPVHEVLHPVGEQSYRTALAEGVQLNHHPDPKKSRAQYLPLLELAVREDPQDDRNTHYLGREYLFRRRYEDCIRTLEGHLSLPSATWADERAASMRYIARAYEGLGDHAEARRWLYRAVGEAPHLREPYTDLAALLCRDGQWEGAAHFALRALDIRERPLSYISEPEAWGSAPYDIAAVAYYWMGLPEKALEYIDRALELKPADERLQENRKWITDRLDGAAHP